MAGRPSARGCWLALAAAALWLPLIRCWARAWWVMPDQAFGWGVPVLAIFLFAERWRRAEPPGGRSARAPWVFFAALALWAADLPVLEANAMWPTAQWWGAAAAVAAMLAALAWAGGWRWAAQFAFPPLFLFTALIWPTPVKIWLVETLSGANAGWAAAIVSAAGHPAVVSGNVIAVSTGLVGITEACSGARSLQAVWMMAWFAGEFFRLNLPRRLFLVAAALGAALVANLGRTVALTGIAAVGGPEAMERWHDRVGMAELALDLLMVAALAWRAHRPRRGPAAPRPVRPPTGWPAWPALRPAVIAVLVAAVVAEAGTQAWYRVRERGARDGLTHWNLAAPDAAWAAVAVPEREVAALRSTKAEGLTWRSPAAPFRASVFLVAWNGDLARGENPEWHDPSICLPAAGARLIAELEPAAVMVAGRQLFFTGYKFAGPGFPVTVYFCHWDAETARARGEKGVAPDDLRARRWQRVWEGRREGDVAHIAFIAATDDAPAALDLVRHWAPVLLRPAAG